MNSLQGLRVLNTRPRTQGQALSHEIKEAGGTVLDCPTLDIEPTNDSWLTLLPHLAQATHAIFISANAVHCCFKILSQKKIIWPETIQVIAIGQATASALHHYRIDVKFIPPRADSEHLLALDSLQLIHGKTILLFKGEGGRTLIAEGLMQRGANLISLDVYRRTLPLNLNQQWIDSLWQNDSVDIILFTSQQSMQNLFTMLGRNARSWLCNKPCLVISNRLAFAASLLGIQTIIINSQEETLLDTLSHFKQGLIHG